MMLGLVDPDPLRLAAWRRLLEASGFSIAWTASTAAEAHHQLAACPVSFLVIASELPDANGPRLLHHARNTLPALSGLVFAAHPHLAVEALAWRAGAIGCLWLDSPWESITPALRHALKGFALWTPQDLQRIQRWWTMWGTPWTTLSPRQRQVAWAAAHGLSNREIAQSLRCSRETVRTHLNRALDRLGRADRVDLARWLAQGGLKDPRWAVLLDLEPLPDEQTLLEAVDETPISPLRQHTGKSRFGGRHPALPYDHPSAPGPSLLPHPPSRGTDHPPLVGTMGETNCRKLLLQEKLLAGGARCGSEGYPDGSSLARWEFCYPQDPPQHRLPHLPLNPNGGRLSPLTRLLWFTGPGKDHIMGLSSRDGMVIISIISGPAAMRRPAGQAQAASGTGTGGETIEMCYCCPGGDGF